RRPPSPLPSQQPAALLQHSAPLAPTRRVSPGAARAGGRSVPILEGIIEIYNQDDVYPPPDHALTLTKMGLFFAALPIVLSFFAGLGIALLVIIVLGGSLILAVFGAAIGAFAKLVFLLMPRRRPVDRKLTQVHLVVQEHDGTQSAVLLYGDHIAGMLHQGDL